MPTSPTFFDWLRESYTESTAYQHVTALRALLRHAGLPDAPDGPFGDLHPETVTLRVRRVYAEASPAAQRNYVGAWNRWTHYLAAVHRLTVPGLTSRARSQDMHPVAAASGPPLPVVVLQALLAIMRPPVRPGSTPMPATLLASAWWGDLDTFGRLWPQAWPGLRLWYRSRTGEAQYLDTDATLPWFVLAAWASGVAHPLTRPADHVPLVPTTRGGMRACAASELSAVMGLGLAPLPAVPQVPSGLVFYGNDLHLELNPWAAPPAPGVHTAPQTGVEPRGGFDLGASLARMATQPTAGVAPVLPTMEDDPAPVESFQTRPPE